MLSFTGTWQRFPHTRTPQAIANAEHSIAGLKWFVDQKDTRMRMISTRKDRPSIEKLKPCTHPPAHYRKPKCESTPKLMANRRSLSAADTNVSLLPRQTAEWRISPPRALSHDSQSVACVPAAVTTQFTLFVQGLGSDRPVLIAASLRLSSRIIPWISVLAVAGATAVSFIICYFSNLMVNFDHGSMSGWQTVCTGIKNVGLY